MFMFIWQHHVPVYVIYIFSVSHLKIVMAAYAYLETHTLLMIITNVNLMTQLLGCFWNPFERNIFGEI